MIVALSLAIPIGGLLTVVLVTLLAAGAADRRAARRRAESAATRVLGDDADHAPRTPRTLVALVALATLFGALASGYLIAARSDDAAQDDQAKASANLLRCQSTVATGWRKGIAVLLIGYTAGGDSDATELPDELRVTAAELDLPPTLDGIRAEGRARIIAALADDARLADVTDRICPYVPGDPARTPDQPVRSATTALEDELAADASTTTTAPPSPTTTNPEGN